MIQFINRLLGKEYKYLNHIELSKNRLLSNYGYLANLNPNFKIAPVLKSNAYGHGIVEIAKLLDPVNPPFFCVDSLHEAYQLYKAKISTPILIMGYFDPENLRVKKLPFSYAVYDLKSAEYINKYQPGSHVHIKIDTGKRRLGVFVNELDNFLDQLKKLPNIQIEGMMSHFASANSHHDLLYQNQIKQFKQALNILKKHHINPKWLHIAASKSILNTKIQKEIFKITNLGRVGRALYGILEDEYAKSLKPVLTLRTKIAQIKKLQKGDKVGYDGTFTALKPMTMAVLPIGYFDGIDRRLSNQGFVTVLGIACKIIGRVSMNITTIDISKIANPVIGQEVEMISSNAQFPNSIQNIAKVCDTIPHEVLVHLTPSTKKIISYE